MHFKNDVIAFIGKIKYTSSGNLKLNRIFVAGPACAFALEPVARLAAYWNTPIITGMGDQVSF